eukprot:COSAG02_NODE_69_length_42323_cov_23.507850_22_plen_150_part_00
MYLGVVGCDAIYGRRVWCADFTSRHPSDCTIIILIFVPTHSESCFQWTSDAPRCAEAGTISEPQAYNATWALCIALAAVNCFICLLVPTDYSSYGKGYTKLDNEQVAIEEKEKEGLMSPSAHSDSDSDEEGGENKDATSIYAPKSTSRK